MTAKVAVLSLGGTIAMASKSGGGGVTPSLTAGDLVAAVPDLEKSAEIEAHRISNIPSTEPTLHRLVSLKGKIQGLEASGYDGVVITQGTDTIEETNWTLDLICSSSLGIVVTGAMRNPTQAGARRFKSPQAHKPKALALCWCSTMKFTQRALFRSHIQVTLVHSRRQAAAR